MQIEFTNLFNKQRKAVPAEVKIALREVLELFLEDPHNSHLRNHALKEEYAGHRSIDITEDWRAIFIVQVNKANKKKVLFKFIGTHKDLYR